MHVVTAAYANGANAALQKFAATRGLKEIRRAVAANDMARANRLATTPGVLNAANPAGSQIRHLGGGAEGLATLVAHPQHGVAVRKMFDPNAAAYSPEVIRRMGARGQVPGMAANLGAATTRHGTPVHFNEFVQGGAIPSKMSPEQARSYARARLDVRQHFGQQGYRAADLRPANAVMTPSGETKFIDAGVFRPEEMPKKSLETQQALMRKPHMRHAILLSEEGMKLYPGAPSHGYDPTVSSANPGQFSRYMFTGQVTPPPNPRVRPTGTEIMSASAPMPPMAKTQTAPLTPTAPMRHKDLQARQPPRDNPLADLL